MNERTIDETLFPKPAQESHKPKGLHNRTRPLRAGSAGNYRGFRIDSYLLEKACILVSRQRHGKKLVCAHPSLMELLPIFCALPKNLVYFPRNGKCLDGIVPQDGNSSPPASSALTQNSLSEGLWIHPGRPG